MKKSVLSTAIAGAMFAASSVAIAQFELPPDLSLPEKGAFTCIEQSLSLVGALIDRQLCVNTLGTYTLDGDILFDGSGSCTIDDTTVDVATVEDGGEFGRGTHQQTSIPAPGEIDDVDFLNLAGNFRYTSEGQIMYADADFQLCLTNCGAGFPGAEDYDEHIIKDFYLEPESVPDRIVIDWGVEVITKEDWPRMKFYQGSRYVPPNGGLGEVEITKVSVAADTQPCFIVAGAVMDDSGGGIQFEGFVWVGL